MDEMIEEIKTSIKTISERHDSDVYLFSGSITDNNVDNFIHMVKYNELRKENCYLILTTNGGDPDAGYRMTRFIKRKYNEFIICVLGACKSTGTMIALGADKIIMGDYGEFGPLDIQLTKDDELSNTSGLSYLQSLNSLNEQAFSSFEESFMNLKRRSGYTITTKTAAEISTKISVGIIAPISAQIDPVKLGEVQRAINIAQAYGKRLTDNIDLLLRLIASFPSHNFVIDYNESTKLFGKEIVSFATEEEEKLEEAFFELVRQEKRDEDVINNLIENFLDKEHVDAPEVNNELNIEEVDNIVEKNELNLNGRPKTKKRTKENEQK